MPEDERPSLTDVAKDGSLAIVAGADTTSGALTATLYYLLCNPIAYDRLRAEVNAAFPTGEELLDVTKISQMEWLNGCINESLRLQPPIPSGSQRSVNKGAGEKVLGKWVIPEGTQVTLRTYTIQRDSRHFHSPETFLPERWFSTVHLRGSQPGCIPPFLIWTCELRREESCVDGDARGALLGTTKIPILQGARFPLRGVGGKDSGLVCGAPTTTVGQYRD